MPTGSTVPTDYNTTSSSVKIDVIQALPTTTTVNTIQAMYSPNPQTISLSAGVFAGTVNNGVATANFTLPAGEVAGSYPIQAVYSGPANFAPSSNTSTLTIPNVCPNPSASPAVVPVKGTLTLTRADDPGAPVDDKVHVTLTPLARTEAISTPCFGPFCVALTPELVATNFHVSFSGDTQTTTFTITGMLDTTPALPPISFVTPIDITAQTPSGSQTMQVPAPSTPLTACQPTAFTTKFDRSGFPSGTVAVASLSTTLMNPATQEQVAVQATQRIVIQ